MALATSTGALLEQIQTAEEVRDNHLEFLDDMVGRLHGSYWRADHADFWPQSLAIKNLDNSARYRLAAGSNGLPTQ